MSADTFVAYCGLRFEIPPDEIEGVELRTDLRIVAARKSNMKYYYGSFGEEERYLLFIGLPVGIFGIENSLEAVYSISELQELYNKTQSGLDGAGFDGKKAAFHFMLEPDF